MQNELIVDADPKASISEAFKTIRTNLLFSSVDKKIKSILVTSSMPGEGKSFFSANLAIAFAQAGSKVLIVDCDMRRGRQHKIFNISNAAGLSNLLIDDVNKNFTQYIYKTNIKNVSVLPAGAVPPNPSDLLSSSKNKTLVQLLPKNYDLVIYDGTPVIGLADSILMADVVDKIIIVSAYKATPIEDLLNTKKSLEVFKKKVAGVVINKMPSSNKHYYTYYK